jgi:hypothetical protein
MDICPFTVFVLSGRGLCDGPIPRPEESYRQWCVSECDQVKIKKASSNTMNKQVEGGRTRKRNDFHIQRFYAVRFSVRDLNIMLLTALLLLRKSVQGGPYLFYRSRKIIFARVS